MAKGIAKSASLLCCIVPLWASCRTTPSSQPEQSNIRYQLGVDYFRNDRIEPALDELQRALKLDPENADAHNLLGLVLLRQGADYMNQVERAACLRGVDADVVRRDATRKFRDAEESLRRAVDLKPEFPSAWNNLSVAALQLQEWDLAIEAARNALRDITYSEPEVARANLGWAYFHKRDMPGAWKELHEAAARSPRFCVGRYRLAKVYMERGDMEMALEEVESVLAQRECPIQEAYLLGGMLHGRRDGNERAKDLFARCVSMAPRSCVAAECREYTGMLN